MRNDLCSCLNTELCYTLVTTTVKVRYLIEHPEEEGVTSLIIIAQIILL